MRRPNTCLLITLCVDEYWDEDYWSDYNIIEPTESLENAVEKLKRTGKKLSMR